jgi:crossover junction endodeoxyribonuclease RuvC
MRLIGLDPGLRITGWGIIEVDGNRLRHVAHGVVQSSSSRPLAERLCELFDGITAVIREWSPQEAAIEETFVNANPDSTLRLGQARGAVLLAPARLGLVVAEYATNQVKKSVVGAGHADKRQIAEMVRRLLPGTSAQADAADALAVAICHAHNRVTASRWSAAGISAGAASGSAALGNARAGRAGAGKAAAASGAASRVTASRQGLLDTLGAAAPRPRGAGLRWTAARRSPR